MTSPRAGKWNRAVFLDRDGVLNRNVFYPDTQGWEAPRLRSHWQPAPGVPAALARLRDAGFLLFLVSNQPNAVNGKSSAEEMDAIHAALTSHLAAADITLTEAFYCRHHPAFTAPCACRKPSPHFVQQAAHLYGLDLGACWFIGDRITDLECGRKAGTRTAWIDTAEQPLRPDAALYDLEGPDLQAVSISVLQHAT